MSIPCGHITHCVCASTCRSWVSSCVRRSAVALFVNLLNRSCAKRENRLPSRYIYILIHVHTMARTLLTCSAAHGTNPGNKYTACMAVDTACLATYLPPNQATNMWPVQSYAIQRSKYLNLPISYLLPLHAIEERRCSWPV